MTTKSKTKGKVIDFGGLLSGDRDGFRELLREALQDVLEVEMTDALGAGSSARTRSAT